MACLTGPARAADTLQNEFIRAEFDDRGLTALSDTAAQQTVHFMLDGFTVTTRAGAIESEGLKPLLERQSQQERIVRFEGEAWTVKVIYELRGGWRFVSKRIQVISKSLANFQVERVEPFRARLREPVAQEQPIRDGALLRLADGPTQPGRGVFFVLQCPFLQWKQAEGRLSMAYEPKLEWSPALGPFASERVCLGPYTLTGFRQAAAMVPEWKWLPEDLAAQPPGATERRAGVQLWTDVAEVEAVVDCVRAFLQWRPRQSTRVHVGWCENDYQIDAATPAGREEYKRILGMAAALGCRHVLCAPANSEVSSLAENRDAWGWENLLWLGLGQKLRKGTWEPGRDPVPASVLELLNLAKTNNLKLLAYVYPSLPFMQNPDWTSWIKGYAGGYLGADTGQVGFQDWFLNKLETFQKATGVGGYSFDHWWIAYDAAPSSKYAQWAGCRHVLETLRGRLPDLVLDGRQQYHQFGVWTWLAGTYPHPLNSDEQPQSFKAFPDLHWDRVSADRQRYIAWWYRNHCFVPPEIMPGYITHQTPRNDARDACRRDRYRPADWDYLGWRYSLLSSIATAPFNHVVNMIPARDETEFQSFSDTNKKWFRDWLETSSRTSARSRPTRWWGAWMQPRPARAIMALSSSSIQTIVPCLASSRSTAPSGSRAAMSSSFASSIPTWRRGNSSPRLPVSSGNGATKWSCPCRELTPWCWKSALPPILSSPRGSSARWGASASPATTSNWPMCRAWWACGRRCEFSSPPGGRLPPRT
ncbi:MAG: hypothetical protein NTW03_11565 [Verrucomicrobia bacterium]|nr:hypothetical protein [Verrucomicrobiota bacterium]